MARCKDCVHVEVCEDFTKAKLSPKRAEELLPVLREHGRTCEHFKAQSRFVELPCLPGDKVFYFDTDERIYVQTVESLIYGLTKTGFVINSEVDFISDLLGKRFFLSYEEAEQALKERENDGK